MGKQAGKPTFTFVDPNTAKEFERLLQKILTNKLLCQLRDGRVSACSRKGGAGK